MAAQQKTMPMAAEPKAAPFPTPFAGMTQAPPRVQGQADPGASTEDNADSRSTENDACSSARLPTDPGTRADSTKSCIHPAARAGKADANACAAARRQSLSRQAGCQF